MQDCKIKISARLVFEKTQEMTGNDEEREGKDFELVSKAAQLGTLANC